MKQRRNGQKIPKQDSTIRNGPWGIGMHVYTDNHASLLEQVQGHDIPEPHYMPQFHCNNWFLLLMIFLQSGLASCTCQAGTRKTHNHRKKTYKHLDRSYLKSIRIHTTAAIFFLTGNPFKDTPEADGCGSTLLSMGEKVTAFVKSPEVYLIVLPEAEQRKGGWTRKEWAKRNQKKLRDNWTTRNSFKGLSLFTELEFYKKYISFIIYKSLRSLDKLLSRVWVIW